MKSEVKDQEKIKIVKKQTTSTVVAPLNMQAHSVSDVDTATNPKSQKDGKEPWFPFKSTQIFSFLSSSWTWQFLYANYVSSFLEKTAQTEDVKYIAHVEGDAKLFAEALVGIQHRQAENQLPCQDAVKVSKKPRPILVLCDGSGSAAVSEQGSQAMVQQLTRFCQSLDPLLQNYLDQENIPAPHFLVRLITRHAIGILEDLSISQRRSIRDFRCTLNMAIVGTRHVLWLKVGDGEIVQEKIELRTDQTEQTFSVCLGKHHKGEFANQTQFIDDQINLEDVQWGVLDAQHTTGIVLMSDGSTEKLVSHQRDIVAPLITQWLAQLRQDQLKITDFYQRFYTVDFLNRSIGDDRSIALYSRNYQFKPKHSVELVELT